MTPPDPAPTSPPDAIRIVPLQNAQQLTAPATLPHLTYRDGPLLTAVQVVLVYWGSAWQAGDLQALTTQLDAFYDAILTSPLIDALDEYSVPGQTIGHGHRAASVTITTPEPGTTATDDAIRSLLQDNLGSILPPATPQTLYMVYLPSGTTVDFGGDQSCSGFCGYHDTIDGQVFYGVLPHPDCSGCLGGMGTFDALTVTSSHELCEAITDPVPGSGWYDDTNGEIGDICAWQFEVVAGYTVQQEWSNRLGRCDGQVGS